MRIRIESNDTEPGRQKNRRVEFKVLNLDALKVERELTKEEILALYLNKIYLGNRAYGVGAAAEVYYGKAEKRDLASVVTATGQIQARTKVNVQSSVIGEIVERKSKRGKVFFGCSNYPDCDFVLWNRPVTESCPRCGATFTLVKTTKRTGTTRFCNEKECGFKEAYEVLA